MRRGRRPLLIGVGALLAGCTGAGTGDGSGGSPTATPGPGETEARPGERTATDGPEPERTEERCHGGYDVSTAPFRPAELLRDPGEERSLLRSATDGLVERTTYDAEPSVRDGVFVELDGVYYETRVSRSVASRETAYLMNLSWERGRTAPEDATVVRFADLPERDQRAFRHVVPSGPSDEFGGHPAEGLGANEVPVPYPDGAEGSRLVGDTTWVRWREREYRVTVGDRTTTTRYTHRYALDRVAGEEAGFRAALVDRYLVRLDDLSDEAASVVRRARGGGYDECGEPPGLAALRERLADAPRLPRNGRSWLVAFEGERFVLRVRGWER